MGLGQTYGGAKQEVGPPNGSKVLKRSGSLVKIAEEIHNGWLKGNNLMTNGDVVISGV